MIGTPQNKQTISYKRFSKPCSEDKYGSCVHSEKNVPLLCTDKLQYWAAMET